MMRYVELPLRLYQADPTLEDMGIEIDDDGEDGKCVIDLDAVCFFHSDSDDSTKVYMYNEETFVIDVPYEKFKGMFEVS